MNMDYNIKVFQGIVKFMIWVLKTKWSELTDLF